MIPDGNEGNWLGVGIVVSDGNASSDILSGSCCVSDPLEHDDKQPPVFGPCASSRFDLQPGLGMILGQTLIATIDLSWLFISGDSRISVCAHA